MTEPKITRPHFPEGYLEAPTSYLTWFEVKKRLEEAIHYWLCTTHPDGRPHVIPKWGVWIDTKFYFDGSPDTRHAHNILTQPNVAVHLESGAEAVIVNGQCWAIVKPESELAVEVARLYTQKYAPLGYKPAPTQWDQGGLFEVTARTILAWTKFTENPTRFTFPPLQEKE